MSSTFDCIEFCKNPSVDKLKDKIVNKDDWKYIATTFKIPYESSHTKEEIKNVVLEVLGSSGILPEEAFEDFSPLNLSVKQVQSPTNSTENLGAWNEHRLDFERDRLQYDREQRENRERKIDSWRCLNSNRTLIKGKKIGK